MERLWNSVTREADILNSGNREIRRGTAMHSFCYVYSKFSLKVALSSSQYILHNYIARHEF